MIYEAQFLSAKAQANSPVSDEMVLLYPEPTVFTKHILVPVDEKGERLGEALTNDPELKRLAIEHGARGSRSSSSATSSVSRTRSSTSSKSPVSRCLSA
jgi:hypothetical protein